MSKTAPANQKLAIYQAKNGSIELRADAGEETIWASLDQIALLFDRNKSVISRHIKSIFQEGELDEVSVVAKNATTAADQKSYQVTFYNLDMIISVGYRVNSKTATQFRKWATQTLKQHITHGWTINRKRIKHNHTAFLKAVEDLQHLTQGSQNIPPADILELIKSFSHTWFSLDSYDKNQFPTKGTKKSVRITAEELAGDLARLKRELISKGEATEIFATEKQPDSLAGIVGNVFQSAFGADVYPTIEEKAANLLYLIVKNHPFTDGNKRSGAFAFIWFLRKAKYDFSRKITPETLATLTILVAESNPQEKAKMIGIIGLLLRFDA